MMVMVKMTALAEIFLQRRDSSGDLVCLVARLERVRARWLGHCGDGPLWRADQAGGIGTTVISSMCGGR